MALKDFLLDEFWDFSQYRFLDEFGIFVCPKCEQQEFGPIYRMARREGRLYILSGCRHHVTTTSGTVFEKSRTPLGTWVYVWQRRVGGISLLRIAKETGLTYKAAYRIWEVLKALPADSLEIRFLLDQAWKNPLSGSHEHTVDEHYKQRQSTNAKAAWAKKPRKPKPGVDKENNCSWCGRSPKVDHTKCLEAKMKLGIIKA